MNSSGSEYVKTLRRLPLFNELSEAELALIAAGVSRLHFKAGTLIFGEGDVCREFLVVEEGEVKLVKSALNGRQQLLRIERKGGALAEVLCLTAVAILPPPKQPVLLRCYVCRRTGSEQSA